MVKTVAPKNKITEKLMKKGLATAHKKHKDDETVIQEGMNLPEGIENGVAQLTEAGLFEYKEGDKGPKGEAYARFTGIVKTPVEHGGVKCKGKRVSVFIPLYDTPKSQKKPKLEHHWADLLNELRKLGVDTSEIEADDIEQAMADLVEEAPHFHFRTWKGQATPLFKNPRVQEVFQGVCEFEDEEDADAGVVTDDDEEEADDEDEKPASKTKTATGGKKPPTKKPPVEEEEDETDDEEEAVDHTANGKAADKGDDEAIDALTEAASEAGLDPDDYDSWAKLAKALNEAGETEEDEADDDEEEGEPEPPTEGEIRVYEGTEVIVGKVNTKKKTANVTDAENDDLYENVPWDDLKEA